MRGGRSHGAGENRSTVVALIDEALAVLLDIDRRADCMPGATSDTVDGDSIHGCLKVKVGPIVDDLRGVGEFVEKDEANLIPLIDRREQARRVLVRERSTRRSTTELIVLWRKAT